MTPASPAPPTSSTSRSSGSEAAGRGALVIGIGNRFRQDDGVGPAVADELEARGVRTLELDGEGTRLMNAWQGEDRVVLVDAVRSDGRPGTIHRLDAIKGRVRKNWLRCSSHEFAVAEAVEMARILERLPQSLVIFGIEGKSYGYGEKLTPNVKQAVPEVARRILLELGSPPQN